MPMLPGRHGLGPKGPLFWPEVGPRLLACKNRPSIHVSPAPRDPWRARVVTGSIGCRTGLTGVQCRLSALLGHVTNAAGEVSCQLKANS